MPGLFRLAIVIGLGLGLAGSHHPRPPPLPAEAVFAVGSLGGVRFGRFTSGGQILEEDEAEETSCPDWRVRR